MKKPKLAWLALLLPFSALAHDLGTEGKVWPISEPSFMAMMVEKAAKVDWGSKANALLDNSKDHVNSLPFAGLTPASKTETTWIDPTLTTKNPISAPVKDENGEWHWKVVFPAGTKVNPLKRIRPVIRMLVFDPRSDKQTAFANAALHAWPLMIRLVASGGEVKNLSAAVGRPVFYANRQMLAKFQLKHTPALIGVGAGKHKFMLAVTTFGPADVDPKRAKELLKKAWYGIEAEQD